MISLDGLWRFQPGDDPDGKKGWADPSFDDSSWTAVRSNETWTEQNLPVASGTFWYRTTVLVPAGSRPLSLFIPSLHICYQVFADGKLIGGAGAMPPHPRPIHTLAAMFTVSGAVSLQAHTEVIAVRAWRYPLWSAVYQYGLEPGILFGDAGLIRQTFSLATRELSWNSVSTIFLALLEILSGLAALALFYVRSQEREYLWFGVAMLLSAANDSFSTYRVFHALDVLRYNLVQAFFQYAILFALVAFYRRLLDGRRDWLYRSVIVSLSIALVLNVVGFTPWILSKTWGLMDFFFTAVFLFTLPFYVWVLIQLARKAREGRVDALILLVSNALGLLDLYVPFMLFVARPAFGWNVGTMAWFTRTAQWPFPFSIDNISSFLLMVTMFAILVHRFTRTSLREEDHKREIEAARIVQQVLIPDAIPVIPGFNIQTAYKPAGQVGGDFFQVLPTRNGGALIVIGDVSGKGMPAAMTVSLLVGTVRTLAHYTQGPGEILAAMNQRMLARSSGGFTTCLVLRADIDGTLTLANAGHVSPYLQGKELQVEGGLPLGLAADSAYKESTFHLAESDQLTLVTDGVVEARGKQGELLGFERTASISTQPAESVVQTAVAFGQEDDITVVTLVRRAAQEGAAIPLIASAIASLPA
jgi:hypothetical protein